MVRPHAGKTIGLQFQPHTEGVEFCFAHPAAHLLHLAADAQQVLHMVADFMRNHVGLCKVPWRAKALGQGFIKRKVDIHLLVSRAVKRAHCRLPCTATASAGLASKQHQTWFLVSRATFGKNIFPNVFGIGQHGGYKFTHTVIGGRALCRAGLRHLGRGRFATQHAQNGQRIDAENPATNQRHHDRTDADAAATEQAAQPTPPQPSYLGGLQRCLIRGYLPISYRLRCNWYAADISCLPMTMKRLATHVPSATVLLTGFDAFGGEAINPSWLVAQALQGKILQGHLVVAAQLPTEFAASGKRLSDLLRKHQPTLVFCLGLAGGRACLSLERIAINIQDARIADNIGAQPIDVPAVESGPAAYFSTLPIKAMLQALTAANIPAEVSQTAGTFVCNHVFYELMHVLKKQSTITDARGGFVHVPYLQGQGLPCMTLEDMVYGMRIAVECALTNHSDALFGAGALN